MIDFDYVLQEYPACRALLCGTVDDDMDLARIAEYAVANKIDLLSALPAAVKVMWPWLEKTKVRLIGRFYLETIKKTNSDSVSDLTQAVNACFKTGGAGAQIFLRKSDLTAFVSQLRLIRDDLFFNKTLSLGLNINDIQPSDLGDIFYNLNAIKADSFVLVLPKDEGDKSDFVGRLYGVLESWNFKGRGGLHFVIGNSTFRMEQVIRLVQKIRPELLSKLKFFMNY